jgi:NADPH-dependent 2,4-dienoyl-CoA reductase/sulfur reductase-like enzyme
MTPTHFISSVLIIGASHAGVACAERLRKLGYDGQITLIDRLAGLPLERPPLSKKFLLADASTPDDSFALRAPQWYDDNQIILKQGCEVKAINPEDKTVTFADGEQMGWDRLVLATGATPRALSVSGGSSERLKVLRHPEDARQLRGDLQRSNDITIIGGGYIGLEVAASARTLGKSVTVVEAADRLLARVASEAASSFFHHLHESHGVKIHTGAQVNDLTEDDEIIKISLGDGRIMTADLVVAGIGVIPEKQLADDAGLTTGNGILTNNNYQSSHGDIYAIGDVALPADGYTHGQIRLESVHHAQMSAEIAAASMLEKNPSDHKAEHEVPWFWSEQYDLRLQSAGLVPAEHHTIRREGRREGQVSFWSFSDNQLKAVEALGDGQAYMVGRSLLASGGDISPDTIADPTTDLKALLKS